VLDDIQKCAGEKEAIMMTRAKNELKAQRAEAQKKPKPKNFQEHRFGKPFSIKHFTSGRHGDKDQTLT